MRKAYELEFDGFWAESRMEGIPSASGVYIVYAGILNEDTRSVSLQKLIYVGHAPDVKAALTKSPLWEQWKDASRLPLDISEPDELGEPNELFFAFAPVNGDEDAERVALAIVYEQHPPLNDPQGYHHYPYEDTKIELRGKTGLLNPGFEIVID